MSAGRGVAVVVAYYAPPALGIASNRLAGLVRHLPEAGWDVVLVAPSSVHHHRTTGAGEAVEGADVIRVPNPEPSRWLRGIAAGAGGEATADRSSGEVVEVRPVPTGRLGSLARRIVADWLYVPDAQVLWIPGAARAAALALRAAAGRRRVLLSTSVPYSCHFAARRAAEETGVPWVAEYRDPWTVAPPKPGGRSALRRVVDRRLDHAVAVAADHLVVTSDRTRALFLEAFPELDAAAVTVVRNGWEETSIRDAPSGPLPSEPLRLAYAGSLLRPEWAGTFLDGVAGAFADEPGSVVLDVYGPEEPWTTLKRARPDGAPWLRLHGMLGAAEVSAVLRAASALVMLQPDALDYVPGKTYDYLGARRPVLADVPIGSEAHELLRAGGELHTLCGLEGDGIRALVRGLLSRHRHGRLSEPIASEEPIAGLSRRSQMERLAAILDEVARR